MTFDWLYLISITTRLWFFIKKKMIRKIHAVSAALLFLCVPTLAAPDRWRRPAAPALQFKSGVGVGRPTGAPPCFAFAGPGTARGRPGPSPAVKEEAEQNHAAGE